MPDDIAATAYDSTMHKSSFYEQLVEHVFISEVLQEVWYRFGLTVEVLLPWATYHCLRAIHVGACFSRACASASESQHVCRSNPSGSSSLTSISTSHGSQRATTSRP